MSSPVAIKHSGTHPANILQILKGECTRRSISNRSPVKHNRANSSAEKLTITTERDADLNSLFISGAPPTPVHVRIFRMDRKTEEYTIFWSGRIRDRTLTGVETEFQCDSHTSAFNRMGLRWCYQTRCNNALFSKACTISPEDHATTGTLTLVEGTTVRAPEFGYLPFKYLRYGYLLVNGFYYMIVDHEHDTLTLLHAIENYQGDPTYTAYAGCDRTMDVCIERFDNLHNFNGFPYSPEKNPFEQGF